MANLDNPPLNLTTECARLWAHYSATNAQACFDVCVAGGDNVIPVVQDDGSCNPSDCIVCSENFTAQFDQLSGVSNNGANAGFLTAFPVVCDDFFISNLADVLGEKVGTTGGNNPGGTSRAPSHSTNLIVETILLFMVTVALGMSNCCF